MSNPTVITSPSTLSNLAGAYDTAHWQTQVCDIKGGIGVLTRGTILATGAGGDIGKLVKLTAGTEAASYGVLLDASVDTGATYSDGSVTGSIAKAGSFRGPALIVPTGVDAGLISVALRGRGIFVEGPITVPAALMAREAEEESKDERPVASKESVERRRLEREEEERHRHHKH